MSDIKKSQKDAVVEAVLREMGDSYDPSEACAAKLLEGQLERIYKEIETGIMNGEISYSKELIEKEVRSYSRSMTMNHLKKAKELNGGGSYKPNPGAARRVNTNIVNGVNLSLLSQEIQDFVLQKEE